MSSSFELRCTLHGQTASQGHPTQLLEVRLHQWTRVPYRYQASNGRLPRHLHQDYLSAPTEHRLFQFPMRQLVANAFSCQLFVIQLLSPFNLNATACDGLATRITEFAVRLVAQHRELDVFRITADINCIQICSPVPAPASARREVRAAMVDESLILGLPARGSPANGAPRSAIEKLRREKVVAVKEEGECSICYEELMGEKKVIRMGCSHLFHEGCIVPWLKKTNACPLCRQPLED